jgi:hypothetical protein
MTATAAKQMTAGKESEINAFLKSQPVSNNKPPRMTVLITPSRPTACMLFLCWLGVVEA